MNMGYDPHKHHRRSIRLKGYDYSQAGAYFVTICVQGGISLLGEVVDGKMDLNEAGKMVAAFWEDIPIKYPTVILDAFVCMPNHIHFIVVLTEGVSLTAVVQWYKSITTAKYRHGVNDGKWPPFNKRFWQRNYYEHIIRNERAHQAIRDYIHNNPANWHADQLYPNAPTNQFNQDWRA
jgi:REP element-mobilizing transposase RayT